MTTMEHTIIFQPSGRRSTVPEDTTILEAARMIGVGIEAVCGDNMVCGKCRVKIMEGTFPKEDIMSSMSHVSAFEEKEKEFFESKDLGSDMRLACAARIRGDVLVFVPESSRTGKQVVSKAAGEIDVEIKPAVKKYYLELNAPALHDAQGDFERVRDALKDFGVEDLTIDFKALQVMPDVLRNSNWKVTVTLWLNEIIRVQEGNVETNIGLAVDVGTTSIAGYLTDLNTGDVLVTESMMNPQVSYGEDVMSRITYCMLNEETGLDDLRKTILEGLNTIIENAAKKAEISTDDISEVTLVGNTAMHHIMLGINPEYMGVAPFAPALHRYINIKADRFGLNILAAGNVHMLPIEAGFVGADNVGCLIADAPHKRDEMTLLIDIGTNGELIFGNKDKLISCSCATGPALEGAQIEYGMRAAPGAIERIRIDRKTHEVTYKVIGDENWSDGKRNMDAKGICGSAIIDGVAEMFLAGVVIKSGNFNPDFEHPRVRKNKKNIPEFVIAWKHETSINEDIVINLVDVRAIQLAKGALYSGCQIMMRRLGRTSFDRLAVAGAFGSHVDKIMAMAIGMFPDCDLDKVEYIGNAAGDGARIALINTDIREEVNDIATKIEYVELALEEDFNDRFGEAMQFPHMHDKFPHLKGILPNE